MGLTVETLPRGPSGAILGEYEVRVSGVDLGRRGPFIGIEVTRIVASFGPGNVTITKWGEAPGEPAAAPVEPPKAADTPKPKAEPKRKPKAEPLDW